MTIDSELADTIAAVGDAMQGTTDPWWIIASAAVALHGADTGRVADVDVLLSVNDARRLLPTLGLAVTPSTGHPAFRSSIFATWTKSALPVEFMAGFRHHAAAGWRPVHPRTRERIAISSTCVFVPSRHELQQILRAFGRPKDLRRAKQLAALDNRIGGDEP